LDTVLEADEARVDEAEAHLRAWVIRHPLERLRADARQAPDGPLRGMTLGVKDVIDTVDLPTEHGSAAHAGRRPSVDAACVALARAAGAVVAGKTVTAELALIAPPVTRNPWDRDRTPGGSSSGSAAAVASGMVRAALGTQTGGSVIRPAAFCGVVGCKPTFGLVPITRVHPVAPSLDTVGWLTRTVADAQALWEVLAEGRTAGDGREGLDERPAAAPASSTGDRRLRLGLYLTDDRERLEPVAREAVHDTGARLRGGGDEGGSGVDVVELDPLPELAGLGEAANTIMLAEAFRSLAWERLHHEDLLSTGLRRLLARGGRISLDELADAHRRAGQARDRFDAALRRLGVDALLTPPAPGEAPGRETTGDSRFCRIWTMLGVPAVTLPWGLGPTGLPVGVQLVGARWGDRTVLAAADRVAAVLPQPQLPVTPAPLPRR
jgi:Asp-tRNA(Asn)/Glu-tRNA(Gln) amidotransferase A subunit family amidase